MKQSVPRLQHYVPQFLLRRFTGVDGKLWAYDTEKQKMFSAGTKGIASEGYFYGTSTQQTAIEHWLAEEIEPQGAEAINRLLAKEALTGKQANSFFTFVAVQMQRTPASLQRATDCFAPTFQETAERIAKYDTEFRNNVIAGIKATGATDEEISQLLQILDGGKLIVTPTRDFSLSIVFDVLEPLVGELAKMKWTFLDIYPTDGDLIIGDHPVTLKDVAPEGIPAGALGVKNPNIEIVMPLSPRMVALAHWDGPTGYGQLAPGMAGMFNKRTLLNAHRFAYAPFESEELLQLAVSLRGMGPKMRTHRLQLGEKLIHVSEFR